MGQLKTLFDSQLKPHEADNDPTAQAAWDQYVKKQQEKDPAWKKFGRSVVDAVTGAAQGLLGTEPNAERRDVSDWSNLATQGVTSLAGLPFAAFKGRGINKLIHGTQRNFETFDPSKYDKSDVLGWMTHAAEDPAYANKYAMGQTKGIMNIGHADYGQPFKSHELEFADWDKHGAPAQIAPRVIPMVPEAKNVLDLVDPNIDDMSQVLAAMEPWKRQELINKYKNTLAGEWHGFNQNDISPAHKSTIKKEGIETTPATRGLAESIRLDPHEFERSPFDAIRYLDVGNKSWAFPAKTPLRAAYGKNAEMLGPNLHPEIETSKIKGFAVPHDYPFDDTKMPVVRENISPGYRANWDDDEFTINKSKEFFGGKKSAESQAFTNEDLGAWTKNFENANKKQIKISEPKNQTAQEMWDEFDSAQNYPGTDPFKPKGYGLSDYSSIDDMNDVPANHTWVSHDAEGNVLSSGTDWSKPNISDANIYELYINDGNGVSSKEDWIKKYNKQPKPKDWASQTADKLFDEDYGLKLKDHWAEDTLGDMLVHEPKDPNAWKTGKFSDKSIGLKKSAEPKQYLKTPVGDISLDDFIKMNPKFTKESAIAYAKSKYALVEK